jgi:hypothetical protein
MKTFILAGAALAALAAIPASAQPGGQMRGQAELTRAEMQQRVQARFARADANRDGFLTRDEAPARPQGVRGERREDRAERRAERGGRRALLFARLDSNRDGMISRAEFDNRAQRGDRTERRAFRAERRADRMERRGDRAGRGRQGGGGGFGRFERVDTNRDGRISLAEAQTGALARFARLDLNRDGRVTREERLRAREQRRDDRGGRRG